MDHNEHDELWELLGKAPERKASPFFANKVMHAIHREPERDSFWASLRKWWLAPLAAGACAAAAIFTLMNQEPASQVPAPAVAQVAPAVAQVAQPAKVDPLAEMVDVIADSDDFEMPLSDLLATEDNSVWLAADPSSLF